MKKWEAKIPQTPSNKTQKRCYRVYRRVGKMLVGGKVVWLNKKEICLAFIKYPDRIFYEVLEKDSLEEYKKYINQTIE